MNFVFIVPGPPQGWRAPAPGRRGQRHHSPPAMRAYADRVRLIARAARPADWPMKARSYGIDMHISQRHAKPDRTNVLKLVEDALRGIAWIDDCRVDDGCVLRVRDRKIVERVEVTVEVLA